MGYDLHITRKADWSDEAGPTISESEWRSIVDSDSELAIDTDTSCADWVFAAWNGDSGSLAFTGGEISAKNPDEHLVRKMAQIASKLGAQVQGDDGEIYGSDGKPVLSRATTRNATPSLFARVSGWLKSKRTSRELRLAAPPFMVGLRVRDSVRGTGTVMEVDPRAEHGLGRVRVRFDDGHEACVAYVASGLEIDSD